VKAPE